MVIVKCFLTLCLIGLMASSIVGSIARAEIQNPTDEADSDKEIQLHKIYKSYSENPTSDGNWQAALGKAKSESYEIQKNDTLWNLSETLFGDPSFWPKLWSLNSSGIGNPHEVSPHQIVKFAPGTMAEPPSLTVGEKMPGGPNSAGNEGIPAGTDEMTELLALTQIPEPTKIPRARNRIPASLPNWSLRSFEEAPAKQPDGLTSEVGMNLRPEVYLTHYAADDRQEEVAKVVETEVGGLTAGDEQNVILKFDFAPEGKDFLAILETDHSKAKGTRRSRVTMVQVLGELVLKDVVNSDKRLYRAVVRRTVQPVSVGAKVVKGQIQMVSIARGPRASQLQARVIGGSYDKNQLLYGLFDVVFFDTGSNQNVVAGQVVPIYRNTKMRKAKTGQVQNNELIGEAKVVKVSGSFTTGIMINVMDEIRTGDVTDPNM